MNVISSIVTRNVLRNILQTNKKIIRSSQTNKSSTAAAAVADIMTANKSMNLIWIDLEMTGLDIEKDQIIEIACLITDKDLNLIAEGPELVINASDQLLNSMDAWCTKTHIESGLVNQVRNSKITLDQADLIVSEFIKQHTVAKQCPLAGNSIHVDKLFIDKQMKRVSDHLHYRIVDVSTIKELVKRWYPSEFRMQKSKESQHRALQDIKESIEELKYYRDKVFIKNSNSDK